MPHRDPANASRLRLADQQLALIENTLIAGTWRWDFRAGNVVWSKGLYRLLGLDPATVVASTSVWQELQHPDDRVDISNPSELLRDPAMRDRVVRVLRPDGSLRHVRSISEVFFDREGAAQAVAGVSFDVTESTILNAEVSRLRDTIRLTEAELGVATWHLTSISGKQGISLPRPVDFSWAAEQDRERLAVALRAAAPIGQPFRVAHLSRDGTQNQVTIGKPHIDARGKIDLWVGLVRDGKAEMVDFAVPPWAIRAARAALAWSAEDLAARSGLSLSTVRRVEAGLTTVRASLVSTLRTTLEGAGVSFQASAKGTISVTLTERHNPPIPVLSRNSN